MRELRWAFLLEVKNRSGERKGFAIHLDDGYILTLHHVLQGASDQQVLVSPAEKAAPPIIDKFEFPGCTLYPYGTSKPLPSFVVIKTVRPTRLNAVSFEGDVALLKLIAPAGIELHRAPIIRRLISNNEPFNCLGPLKHHEEQRDQVVSGVFVLGSEAPGLKWPSGSDPIIPGFSGAPVYDASMDRVLGLVQWVRNFKGDPVEAYMLEIKTFPQLIPEIERFVCNPSVRLTRAYPDNNPHVKDLLDEIQRRRARLLPGTETSASSAIEIDMRVGFAADLDAAYRLTTETPTRAYPENIENFFLSPDRFLELAASASRVSHSQRLYLLRSQGGAGKSSFLERVLERSWRHLVVPHYVDARDLTAGSEERPRKLPQTVQNVLAAAFGGGWDAFLYDIEQDPAFTLLVIDQFDQLPSEAADATLRILKSYASARPQLAVLISDRLVARDATDGYQTLAVRTLSAKVIVSALEKRTGTLPKNLSTEMEAVLATPLMLDIALRLPLSSGGPIEIDNRIALFEQYFGFILGHETPEYGDWMRRLSEWAWRRYRDTLSTAFATQDWEKEFSSTAEFTSVRQHIVVVGEQTGTERFRHQSFHDYLVGRYLADDPNRWNGETLDSATWYGANPAPVILAAELVGRRGKGSGSTHLLDQFLIAVYDWNYPAVIACVRHLVTGPMAHETWNYVSFPLRDAFGALMALKIRDLFEKTGEDSKRELLHFESQYGDEALLAKYRDTVRNAGSEKEAAEQLRLLVETEFCPPTHEDSGPDYTNWKLIFCLSSVPNMDFCIHLVSGDPLIGWTAANAMRREALRANLHINGGSPLPAVLRLMYQSARCGATAAPTTSSAIAVRRRLVYTMGVLQDAEARELILHTIFDPSEAVIVREDAARCVLEIAARDSTQTASLLAKFACRVAASDETTFPGRLRHRIHRSCRLTAEYETETWRNSIGPLLKACLTAEQQAPDTVNRDVWLTERWPGVIAHFSDSH
jgi:hypothetical protein